ncbi:mobile mystery protein B [bacterium]|nr:mobile mystery protein B [bacterium]
MIEENPTTGQTALDPNEIDGLIPSHIMTRAELDRLEHDNIVDALDWLDRRKPKDVLDELFLRRLHQRMFGEVWRWAGSYRQSDKNLGITFHQIPVQVSQLLDNVKYWLEQQTYPPDEIAVRFHHHLVSIHPFSNGNGRHARVMADLLLERRLDQPMFTWGRGDLASIGEVRRVYIEALKAADGLDYAKLLEFVRS